jgi:hypothetical protein
MQHLCAQRREDSGLACADLRHEPRVGDGSWIGGEYSRHILPEHNLPRVEHAREQRGRQIRTATTERHDVARETATDESRDDRDEIPRQQRLEDVGRCASHALDVGRCVAVPAVGMDDAACVDGGDARASCFDCGGEDVCSEALAMREYAIERRSAELPSVAQSVGQGTEVCERVEHGVAHDRREGSRPAPRDDSKMAVAEPRDVVPHCRSACGSARDGDESIRDASESRHDCHRGRAGASGDERRCALNARSVSECGAAELVDGECRTCNAALWSAVAMLDCGRGSCHGGAYFRSRRRRDRSLKTNGPGTWSHRASLFSICFTWLQ